MTQRKRKKSIKMRGSRTFGYGSHKKHRGAGSRGGRGNAGTKKHKKTLVMTTRPEHLGKRGFHSLTQRKIRKGKRSINVCDIERMAEGKKEIDLSKAGYDKVLGKGTINSAITVKAAYFTESARQKIEGANGKVVVPGGRANHDF
ncbi:MAG: 50S ribosomal protein L15 [Candidatus Aenigmatarchaeota archaeon]|nr:MAG: 50S ribosomal protein L15 [Candidatus Aenigmarchaeota archaeon]